MLIDFYYITDMADTKKQHYIPQFLLENFSVNEKHQINVFNKETGKKFVANITDIAHENHLYDIKTGKETRSLEPAFAELESDAAPIIKRIIERKSLGGLDEDNKVILSIFIAIQSLRTRYDIDNSKKMMIDFLRWALPIEMAASDYELPDELRSVNFSDLLKEAKIDVKDDFIKSLHFKSAADIAREVVPRILSMDWLLFETVPDEPFLIGDGAVVMTNEHPDFNKRGLGFAVPYIQIYLPLSNTLMLGLHSPLIKKDIREKRITLQKSDPVLAKKFIKISNPHFQALVSKRPLQLTKENVEYYNHLQVLQSGRFLYSRNDDFSLARDMLNL